MEHGQRRNCEVFGATGKLRGMRKLKFAIAAAMLGAVLLPMSAAGQQPIFYPAKGQSGQQQNRDQGECQVWAQQTTGINPAALAQTPPPQAPKGPAVGGGERVAGAARGAVLGEVMGGHSGEGALAGAMVGGARARRNQAQQQQATQQQANSARSSQISTYNRAVGACMEGRGYTVR